MAFFGKEFRFQKQENFEQLVEALGISGEVAKNVVNNHPTQKLVQDGDGYILSLIASEKTTELNFKNGEEFDEAIAGGTAKTTIAVDGNVVTQTQKAPSGRVITIKREFSDDTLKATITASTWDGAAYRYFKA